MALKKYIKINGENNKLKKKMIAWRGWVRSHWILGMLLFLSPSTVEVGDVWHHAKTIHSILCSNMTSQTDGRTISAIFVHPILVIPVRNNTKTNENNQKQNGETSIPLNKHLGIIWSSHQSQFQFVRWLVSPNIHRTAGDGEPTVSLCYCYQIAIFAHRVEKNENTEHVNQ